MKLAKPLYIATLLITIINVFIFIAMGCKLFITKEIVFYLFCVYLPFFVSLINTIYHFILKYRFSYLLIIVNLGILITSIVELQQLLIVK